MDLPIFCSFRFFFFLSDYGYHPNGNDCVRDEHKPPELCIHGDVETDNLGSVRLVLCDFAVLTLRIHMAHSVTRDQSDELWYIVTMSRQ